MQYLFNALILNIKNIAVKKSPRKIGGFLGESFFCYKKQHKFFYQRL